MDNEKPPNFLRKNFPQNSSRANPTNKWLDAGAGMGKLPPQATDLEEAVLGALMIEKDALNTVIDVLKPESFYKEANQRIYNAIVVLFNSSNPVDLLTVTNQLRELGEIEIVGGAGYITQLTTKVNSAANIEYHARIITQAAMKRDMIRIASEILREAYDDTTDVFSLMDRTESGLFQISESNIKKNYADMGALMGEALKELERRRDQKDGLTGVPSGFSGLDRITSGWQPTELIILAARPGMGKCLGKGTKVVMFDGTLRNVEKVQAGDLLMGDDSTPRRVLSLARGMENMYWVHQNKGISYRVNESHILSLKRSRNEGPHQKGDVLNVEVRDYLQKSDKFRSNYKGYKVAIELAEKSVEIDPYFMGIWLGDGHSYSSRITNIDPEVVAYLDTYANELNLNLVKYEQFEKTPNYAITSGQRGVKTDFCIQEELRELNVLQNKHILDDYLYNSAANRLKLLAGLIDSDGHYQAEYDCYEITQKNEQLACQIKYLADSLGFRVSMREKRASIAQTGFESTVYRVRISGDLTKIPVKIERKKARLRQSQIDWRVTGIELEFDCFDEYYGFEIDGNHLFLLEDMTVTHNTAFVVSSLRNAAVDFNMPVAIFSLEMSSIQLVNRMISAEAEIDGEKLKKGNLAPHEWTQLHQRIDRLMRAPIYIDDTPALSILELRAKSRRLKQQHDIQMIVIDYLQLMQGDTKGFGGGNREQEIASISRALKNLAKELNVPVIALSQLSRAVETRGGDKRPQLSDLRESGCLTGDTLILDAKTGKRCTIKSLAERKEQSSFTTLAVDDFWKIEPHQMVKVFYSGKKQVFELKTKSGRTIKASANHPFLKLGGWNRLDELTVGDKIAIPRKITVQSTSNPLSNDELILLAHLLGDGCILPKQPYHYTSADPENIQIVAQTAHNLLGIKAKTVRQENWEHLYLKAPYHLTHGMKHPITSWYEKLGLQRVRSYNKQIPESLFECDEARIALFLKHLWATDGNISWKKSEGRQDAGAIYYGSTSSVLVEQIQHLLLRLGIQSTVRTATQKENYRPSYHVQVQGAENQLLFLTLVGCYGERGRIVPKMIDALRVINPNPNNDIIPKEAWAEIIEPLKAQLGMSWRGFAQEMNVAYSGSSLFKRGISRNRMNSIAEILPFAILKNLAESDVLWDEVISITALGIEDVYDATVDNVHNFVANDMLVHNSIEQDADVVAFLYRPDYYGFTQDEAGNSVQGIGEVIIAKNRSGSLETVQLRFIGKYTKFADLDSYYSPSANAPGSFSSQPSATQSFDASVNPPTGGVFRSKANDLGSMDFPQSNPSEEPPF